MQIVEDGKKQAGIDQDADQFLPGNVFNVRVEIPDNGVNDEGHHRPADRRPEQLRPRTEPEARPPKQQHAQRQPLKNQERQRERRSDCQRAKNQDSQHQGENAPFAPAIPGLAIHQPFGRNSRGSVTLPVSALAATVAGEARNTCESLWPMRPGKLRLVALMHLSGAFMRPNVSTGPPRHAAQPAFSVICTPASVRICQTVLSPQRAVCRSCTISGVAGTPNVSMTTRLPCTTRAKARKSLVFPPVQEPM